MVWKNVVQCLTVIPIVRHHLPLFDFINSWKIYIYSCQKWIELAQNKKISKLLETYGPLDLPTSFSICSIHFTKDDYITNTGRSLLVEYKLPIHSKLEFLTFKYLVYQLELIVYN